MTNHLTRLGFARFVLGVFALAATAILPPPSPVQAATEAVAVENYDFSPASRTIDVGDTVRWTFSGDQHSVTSRDGLFDSGVLDPGGSFQFTFTKAGTFRYYCLVHPGLMSGTIVVKAESSTPKPTVRADGSHPQADPEADRPSDGQATPEPTARVADGRAKSECVALGGLADGFG